MGSGSAARELRVSNTSTQFTASHARGFRGRDALPPDGVGLAKVIDINEARARLRPETLNKKRAELSALLDSTSKKCEAAIFGDRKELFSLATSIASDASRFIGAANAGHGALPISGNDSTLMINFMAALVKALKQTEKGAIRRVAEPPSDHYLMAWVVWIYYLVAYMRAGLRVSEESKRLELHLKSVSGLGK